MSAIPSANTESPQPRWALSEYGGPDKNALRVLITQSICAMGCLGWEAVEGTDQHVHLCRSRAGNVGTMLVHQGYVPYEEANRAR